MKTNFKKVNYPEYKGMYDEDIKARMETAPENIDIETMRASSMAIPSQKSMLMERSRMNYLWIIGRNEI